MFLAIPFFLIELYLSLKTGETIGFFWSVVWIIASAVLGMILLQNSPHAIMGQMQSVQRGKLDLKKFQDASMAYFIGSILLIIPGVFSDFFPRLKWQAAMCDNAQKATTVFLASFLHEFSNKISC